MEQLQAQRNITGTFPKKILRRHKMKLLKRVSGVLAIAGLLGLSSVTVPAQAADKVVKVAYQATYSPWIQAMVEGTFEKRTGYKINWRKFNSGSAVMNAMASGDIDIGVVGSSPLAAATSRGLDLQLFWIAVDIANAEALMVRDGSGIKEPRDLAGKVIAVPIASTSHYQLMYILEKWGVSNAVKIINMSPEQSAAAWERGDIDGAFIWGPALSRIKKNAKPLVTAGQICEMGTCTFEGMVATKKFAGANKDFMRMFVTILNETNEDFIKYPHKWGPNSKPVLSVVRGLGGNGVDAAEEMALYKYPSLAEQNSCQWLGCGNESGAVRTLKSTAEFLKKQGKVDAVLSNYSQFVDPQYVNSARKTAN
jgi:taurine transport system substrate-binding protein